MFWFLHLSGSPKTDHLRRDQSPDLLPRSENRRERQGPSDSFAGTALPSPSGRTNEEAGRKRNETTGNDGLGPTPVPIRLGNDSAFRREAKARTNGTTERPSERGSSSG